MSVKSWLRGLWADVKGNAKWDVIKYVALVVAGAAIAWAVGVVRWVLRLTRGLTTEQQGTLLTIYVALLALFVIVATFAVVLLWKLRRSKQSQAPVMLKDSAPSPLPPRPPGQLVPPRPRLETEFHIEILEKLFRPDLQLLSGFTGWFIALKLRITNRGATEPAVTFWSLKVIAGKSSRDAELVALPDDWYIERSGSHYGAKATQEDFDRPSLDRVSEREEFKKGKPRVGWVVFRIWGSNEGAPHNAKLEMTVRDAMGVTHQLVQEPEFYVVTGTIKVGERSGTSK